MSKTQTHGNKPTTSKSQTHSGKPKPTVSTPRFRSTTQTQPQFQPHLHPNANPNTTQSPLQRPTQTLSPLRLLLFPPRLSPPPRKSLATRSRTYSGSCLAESSSPFNSLPNSLTLRSPYDVIPRVFCFSSIARWVDMEGDHVFCFVAFGLDLGSWLLLLLLG